jgi:hypothetical protein
MMSVHDSLETWQSGQITTAQAMRLTGATDIMDLYAFAHECDVEIRTHLLPREEVQVTQAAEFIDRLIRRDEEATDMKNSVMSA